MYLCANLPIKFTLMIDANRYYFPWVHKIIIMFKQIGLLMLLIILTGSCSDKVKLKRELLQLQSEKIVLSIEEMRLLVNGRDTLLPDFADCQLKLIVYSDSSDCSSCMLEKIHVWDSLLLKTVEYDQQFEVFFIFSPAKSQRHDVEFVLKYHHFHYPVFLDISGKFLQCNPHIPENKVFHTFLLDKDNKVIMAGNPLFNRKIETMLYQKLKEKLKGI